MRLYIFLSAMLMALCVHGQIIKSNVFTRSDNASDWRLAIPEQSVVEDIEMESKIGNPVAVLGNKLLMFQQSSPSTIGLVSYDGATFQQHFVNPVAVVGAYFVVSNVLYSVMGPFTLETVTYTNRSGAGWYYAETVTGGTSTRTGTVVGWTDTELYLYRTATTDWTAAEVLTGSVSGTTANLDAQGDDLQNSWVLRHQAGLTKLRVISKTGYYVLGEAVNQATSGAAGIVVDYSATSVGFGWTNSAAMWVLPNTGSPAFDATHVITGATSGATVTAVGVWTDQIGRGELAVQSQSSPSVTSWAHYASSMVSCGANRMVYAPYDSTASYGTNTVWISTDNGTNWTEAFTPLADSIRHWHFAKYYTNSAGELLALGSGDPNGYSSIVICTNTASFFADPGTWKTNWGLHLPYSSRAAWFAGDGSGYAMGNDTTQAKVRALDLAVDDNGDAWWITDNETTDYYGLYKWDRSENTITRMDTTSNTIGLHALTTSSGLIAITTSSYPAVGTPKYPIGEYAYVYAFDPLAFAAPTVLMKRRVSNWMDPDSGTRPAWMGVWIDVYGTERLVWGNVQYTGGRAEGWEKYAGNNAFCARLSMPGVSAPPPVQLENLAVNGDLTNSTAMSGWTTVGSYLTVAEDSLVIDSAFPKPYARKSFRFDLTASSSAPYLSQTLSAESLAKMSGKWCTFQARLCGSLDASQLAQISIVLSGIGTTPRWSKTWTSSPAAPTNHWFTASESFWCAPENVAAEVRIYPRGTSAGTYTGTLYMSDFRLVVGAYRCCIGPSPVCAPNPSASENDPIVPAISRASWLTIPTLTTTAREAISSPPEGMAVWDADLHKVMWWDATHWTNGW